MDTKAKQEKFLDLLDPLHNRLMRFCRAISTSNEEAKDLASEAILQAYENFERLKKNESFRSYIFQIASRINKRRIWRKRFFLEKDEDAFQEIMSPDPAPDKELQIEELYNAIAMLPQKQREALVLFEISGFSLDEVREIQGGSLSGVKSRLKRGREKLAELLQDNTSFENVPFSENGDAAGSHFIKDKLMHKVKNG